MVGTLLNPACSGECVECGQCTFWTEDCKFHWSCPGEDEVEIVYDGEDGERVIASGTSGSFYPTRFNQYEFRIAGGPPGFTPAEWNYDLITEDCLGEPCVDECDNEHVKPIGACWPCCRGMSLGQVRIVEDIPSYITYREGSPCPSGSDLAGRTTEWEDWDQLNGTYVFPPSCESPVIMEVGEATIWTQHPTLQPAGLLRRFKLGVSPIGLYRNQIEPTGSEGWELMKVFILSSYEDIESTDEHCGGKFSPPTDEAPCRSCNPGAIGCPYWAAELAKTTAYELTEMPRCWDSVDE